jgi:hypothetical protein
MHAPFLNGPTLLEMFAQAASCIELNGLDRSKYRYAKIACQTEIASFALFSGN